MSRRGFHFPDLLVQRMYELTGDYAKERPTLNHVARLMIELGVPVFRSLRSSNPGLAKELMRRQYAYKKRRKATDRAWEIAQKRAAGMRIDDRLYVGIPTPYKQAFLLEKKRTKKPMSAQARERMGIV